jgi:hypothetical protein
MQVTLAYCAALLVQEYAIYAKHSGIPEIKTVLGGFVIRKFLGGWTLLTKSLGLVRLLRTSPALWRIVLTSTGPGCRLRNVARKGGSSGSRSVLLCEPLHQAVLQYQ